jgi:hypothetical protein
MSATDHVEKLKREMVLIRSAFQIGRIDARVTPRPEKNLDRWMPSVRTAYLFSKLLEAPDSVTSDELPFLDWGILSGIEIRHPQR